MSTERVALAAELANKVDKVSGKGLSTNDFTTPEKDKLDGLKPYTIPYGALDATSTSTAMTVTVHPAITAPEDGVTVIVKNGVVTSAAGFTIDVNGLGAKPVYNSMNEASRETTIFSIAYTVMLVYDSTRVEGGCWVFYRGYNSDTNSVGFQIRYSYGGLPAAQKGYKCRLWFKSPDGKSFVPANTSTSTNAKDSRTPNTAAIDPFGSIVYNSDNASYDVGDVLRGTFLWTQINFTLGYSFNTTGAELSLTYPCPVWIKCTPQSDGSATLQGYVQSLQSSADGFIYIFLGIAYSSTMVELNFSHPVYYHDGTGIRAWTGSEKQAKITASGILKGDGLGGVSAAAAGTDYQAPLSAYTSDPEMDGTASAGSSADYSKGDHVHPTDTSRASTSQMGSYAVYPLSELSGSSPITLQDRKVQLYTPSSGTTTVTFALPTQQDMVPASSGVYAARDIVLEIDNSGNSSDVSIEFSNLGTDFMLLVPDTEDLAEMTTVSAGEMARIYLSDSKIQSSSKPLVAIHRLTLVPVSSKS